MGINNLIRSLLSFKPFGSKSLSAVSYKNDYWVLISYEVDIGRILVNEEGIGIDCQEATPGKMQVLGERIKILWNLVVTKVWKNNRLSNVSDTDLEMVFLRYGFLSQTNTPLYPGPIKVSYQNT